MREATRRCLTAGLPDPMRTDEVAPTARPAPRGLGPLFARSLGWGLLTGTSTGGVVGLTIGLAGLLSSSDGYGPLALFVAVAGAICGLVVAALPSLLGAAFVAQLACALPGHATSADWDAAVRRRLIAVHVAVNALLAPLLVEWFGAVDGLERTLVPLCLVTGNLTIHVVLRRARRAIVEGRRPVASPASGPQGRIPT